MTGKLITFLFFAAAVAVAGLFSSLFSAGEWYEALSKPPWVPPDWLFGPVWAVLYLMMAIAAWRVWGHHHWLGGRALTLWAVQLVLNGAWSWLFFGKHNIGGGVIVLAALWATIMMTINVFRRVDKLAAKLMMPVLAWVFFALLLNLSIWWMNGGSLLP
jgi:tryptophan-rich sensory protein